MRSLCVAVPKVRAEDARLTLLAKGLLRKGVAIVREGDSVLLPITERVDMRYPVSERDFPEAYMPIRSYKDIAEVPADLRPLLPTSFDVIGDIAIIKIPDELTVHEREIADAILRTHSGVRVVAADAGVRGPLRIRSVRILAGPNRTETIHREHGVAYKVDVARAYFSPRLGTERLRIAQQVMPGETVVDMFAGVGPYAILIARRRQPRVVYAFDANPDAFRWLEENVRRNRATGVEPRQGDALSLLAAVEPPDRVIIDYPQNPEPAYRAVLPRIVPGGVIHYHAILDSNEVEDATEELLGIAGNLGREAEIIARREVHGWSPTQKLFAFDVRAD